MPKLSSAVMRVKRRRGNNGQFKLYPQPELVEESSSGDVDEESEVSSDEAPSEEEKEE